VLEESEFGGLGQVGVGSGGQLQQDVLQQAQAPVVDVGHIGQMG
jgi:hypothetical protein